jgi:hypothetical protein
LPAVHKLAKIGKITDLSRNIHYASIVAGSLLCRFWGLNAGYPTSVLRMYSDPTFSGAAYVTPYWDIAYHHVLHENKIK